MSSEPHRGGAALSSKSAGVAGIGGQRDEDGLTQVHPIVRSSLSGFSLYPPFLHFSLFMNTQEKVTGAEL